MWHGFKPQWLIKTSILTFDSFVEMYQQTAVVFELNALTYW